MGLGENSSTVYIIDFGLVKSIIDQETGQHIRHIMSDKKKSFGTCHYASFFSHFGYELSRRDDLISLGYVIIYLAKGRLPWQNTPLN